MLQRPKMKSERSATIPKYTTPIGVKRTTLPHVVKTKEEIDKWLDRTIHLLDYPEIFASGGDELNSVHRDWDTAPLRICLVGGMTYRNSVGNLAIPLLYSEITEDGPQDWYIDRAYAPESRKNFELTSKGHIPTFGLQSHQPLANFDILAFSCSYLQTMLHVGLILKWSGIPPKAKDRTAEHPLVLVGGHHAYVNMEPIWEIPDVIFVGEFSEGGRKLLEDYHEARQEGVEKWDWITDYAKIDESGNPRAGFYVPSFYTEEYSQEYPYPISAKYSHVEGVPDRVPKAYVVHLDTGMHISGSPLVPFVNPTMGTAEIQSSQGCDYSACTFCSEGQTNKPFRFFSVDRIVEYAKKQMLNTGMRSFTLAAFDGAGHPQKNYLLHRLLEEVSDNVSLLSLRVDETANDPAFARLSTLSGNRTLSVGVEGMSERMRRVFVKGCPEDSILKVCKFGMENGATKIKFFLIANHPWETEADRMEWIETLKKVEEIKTQLGSKCQILSSWTPLVIMPWTPLQWEAPTPDHRTLHGVIREIKAQTKTDFRIGSGGRRDEAYMAQLLQLGDRRLSVVMDWCLERDFIHYGSTPKGTIEKLANVMARIPGFPEPIGFKHFFRARDYDEILPWDVIDIFVEKGWLQMVNEVSKLAEQEIPGCTTGCSACGACTTIDRTLMASGVASGDVKAEPYELNILQERGRVQVMRLKTVIDRSHRFIGTEYWLAGIIRAHRLAGIPVDKSWVRMVSTRLKFYDYSYGIEYFDVGVRERQNPVQVMEAIKPHLPSGMKLVGVKAFSPSISLEKNAGAIHFIIDPRPYFSPHHTHASIARLLGADKFITKIKKEVYGQGVRGYDTDIRPWVDDAWIDESGLCHMLLTDRANPFELLQAIFSAPRSIVLRMDVIRADIYTAFVDTSQDDLFRPRCAVNGTILVPSLMDETDPSGLSLRAKFPAIHIEPVHVGTVFEDQLTDDELKWDSELALVNEEFSEMMVEEKNVFGNMQDDMGVTQIGHH